MMQQSMIVQRIRRARMAFALTSADPRTENNAITTHPNVNSPSRYCHVVQ